MSSRIYAVFTEYDKSVFADAAGAKIHRNNGSTETGCGRDIRTMTEGLPEESLGRLRVLYISALEPDYYGEYRLRALRRLGLAHVAALDLRSYGIPGILGKLQHRFQMGPEVQRFNRDLLSMARQEDAQVILFDKSLQTQPGTLRQLRAMDRLCVDFVIDNPFGPRRDPGWRLYRRTIPEFDLTGVQRDVSLGDYQRAGARETVRIRTSYEPSVHYPPDSGWSDGGRDRNVSFIGTPYDDRGGFLARLWRAGVPVDISGSRPHWQAALPADAFAAVFRSGELKGDAYREAIWRSRINLAFVTHSNRDQVAHKSFEITACGGFLLAERTPEHLACFREDEEAVFFSDFEECRAKIERYLNDEPARIAIAAAGQRRAQSSGYDNDSVLRRLLGTAAELLAARDSKR
jgi:spore maturation protein CgeB